jgi:hypothetical protein
LKPRKRLSKLALFAATTPIIFLLVLIGFQIPIFQFLILVLAVPCLLAPIAGWMALAKIEDSDGMLIGRRLALVGVYLPILVIFNALLFLFAMEISYLFIAVSGAVFVTASNWAVFRAIRAVVSRYSFRQFSWKACEAPLNGGAPA